MSMREKKSLFTVTPLYLQAYQLVAARIASGVYAVGSPLPNEVELAREMGISVGTVRKALVQLEDDRILSRIQGQGTFVKANVPALECPDCDGTGRISPKEGDMSRREKIEVTATILEVRDKSLKITDGTTKDFTNRETGEITKRPVWFFLPKSQVGIEDGDMADIADYVGKTVTLLIPQWLCEEKGLV